MKPYLAALRAEFQVAMVYKTNAALYLTYVLIPPLAAFFFWTAILAPQDMLGEYTLSALVTYYIVTQFFATNTPFSAWADIGDSIRTGEFSQWLIRPVSHYKVFLARLVGAWIPMWAMGIAGVAILGALLGGSFQWQGNPILVLGVGFWLGGVMLGFTFGYLLNLVAFWTERTHGILQLSYAAAFFLAGGVVPLDLLPLAPLWQALPFRYAGYVPAQIFLGRLPPSCWPQELLLLAGWALALLVLTRFVWRVGLRRYQAAGG